MSLHSKVKSESDTLGLCRKLEEIGQALVSMTTKEDIACFLDNPENMQKLNGLVEDIRYALVDYQVCTQKRLILVVSNICFRPRFNEISPTRVVSRS